MWTNKSVHIHNIHTLSPKQIVCVSVLEVLWIWWIIFTSSFTSSFHVCLPFFWNILKGKLFTPELQGSKPTFQHRHTIYIQQLLLSPPHSLPVTSNIQCLQFLTILKQSDTIPAVIRTVTWFQSGNRSRLAIEILSHRNKEFHVQLTNSMSQ